MKTSWLFSAVLLAAATFSPPASAERVRDLAEVRGARENQLLGYGIVTGLAGSGDDASAPFAAQSVLAMLRRLGVQVDPKQIKLRNVAAVMVTATLPAFAKPGTKLDIHVSSIGNAKSLAGGTLVQTLLRGADQKTYAVAQGQLLVGGYSARGASGSSASSGSMTSGRIPEGALVEREIVQSYVQQGNMQLSLRTPSFAVSARMAAAIDTALGAGTARAEDGGTVVVRVPAAYRTRPVELVAAIEDVEVVTIRRARVVINERTGTIVAGGDVRLAPAAVVHGGLTIVVKEAPQVSQPTAPLGGGKTAVTPKSEVDVQHGDGSVRFVPPSASLTDVAAALGLLGLSPRELTSVLQALRSAGVLEAELLVQ